MANTYDVQKINDGDRNATFRIYLASDGTTGDESDVALVDVSTLNVDEHGNTVDNVKVMRVQAHFTGFTGLLEYTADTDDEILSIPDGDQIDFDFTPSGGIPNPKSTGYTGDITISTGGFTASGDEGTIYLECKKRYG